MSGVFEFLSKRTAALREIDESKTKIFEQLELNINELEKTNRRLQNELTGERKKSKSLQNGLEISDKKCEELEQVIIELKADLDNQQQRKRERRKKSTNDEDGNFNLNFESENRKILIKQIESQQQQKTKELEMEITRLYQDNESLRKEISVFRRRETTAIDKFSINHCPCCSVNNNNKCQSFLDLEDIEVEEEEEDYDDFTNSCKLVKLPNGGLMYGNRDSLLGGVLDGTGALEEASLLNEMDTQYRVLIEKYETLIKLGQTAAQSPTTEDEEDELSNLSLESSSGFSSSSSEGAPCHSDVRVANKHVQTDIVADAAVRLPKDPTSIISHTPEYKKLFLEIFNVLKQRYVNNLENLSNFSSSASKIHESHCENRRPQHQQQQSNKAHMSMECFPCINDLNLVDFPSSLTVAQLRRTYADVVTGALNKDKS